MTIDYKLSKDIEAYCEINDIADAGKFASELLKKAFLIEKYGERPEIVSRKEKKEPEKIKKEYISPKMTVKEKEEEKTSEIQEEKEEKTEEKPKKTVTRKRTVKKVEKEDKKQEEEKKEEPVKMPEEKKPQAKPRKRKLS